MLEEKVESASNHSSDSVRLFVYMCQSLLWIEGHLCVWLAGFLALSPHCCSACGEILA